MWDVKVILAGVDVHTDSFIRKINAETSGIIMVSPFFLSISRARLQIAPNKNISYLLLLMLVNFNDNI
jgi:hypothetical protein